MLTQGGEPLNDGGVSGGTILDSSWEVVDSRGGCEECVAAPLKNFSGDKAIFVPTQVATTRGGDPVTMYGDYYGIVNSRALVQKDGTRWSRKGGAAAPTKAPG